MKSGRAEQQLVRLGAGMGDAYLYVGRIADPVVLNRVQQTKWAVEQYDRLESQRSDYQIKFALGFLVLLRLLGTSARPAVEQELHQQA